MFGVEASATQRDIRDAAQTFLGLPKKATMTKPLDKIHGRVAEAEVQAQQKLLGVREVLVSLLGDTRVESSSSMVSLSVGITEHTKDREIDRGKDVDRNLGAVQVVETGATATEMKVAIVLIRKDVLRWN